jgi:hypothetical protein
MNDQEIIRLAKTLVEAGIQLNAVYEPIGCMFCLRPSDLAPFLKDRELFFANECALEKADYTAWKRFISEGRPCAHRGHRGPCKRPAKDSRGISPQEYVRRRNEGTLLCSKHLSAHTR